MNKSVKNIIVVLIAVVCVIAILVTYLSNKDLLLGNNLFNNSNNNNDFVKIIDVGQGDSILIGSNDYSLLIDTGISDNANELCSSISEHNIDYIDVLLLTHLDSDHVGGVSQVIEVYKPKKLILPELSIEEEGLTTAYYAINKVKSYGGEIFTAVQGMNFDIGNFKVTVLAQYSEMQSDNNRSIVTMAENNGKRFLFTGDLEYKGEKALLNEGLDLKADVLKVGHHGSNSSTSDQFLKAVSPQYAAISVGSNNRYGHPNNRVLSALNSIGAKIYRTDTNGDIIFYIDNDNITIDTSK